jgi:hypothetical protein
MKNLMFRNIKHGVGSRGANLGAAILAGVIFTALFAPTSATRESPSRPSSQTARIPDAQLRTLVVSFYTIENDQCGSTCSNRGLFLVNGGVENTALCLASGSLGTKQFGSWTGCYYQSSSGSSWTSSSGDARRIATSSPGLLRRHARLDTDPHTLQLLAAFKTQRTLCWAGSAALIVISAAGLGVLVDRA